MRSPSARRSRQSGSIMILMCLLTPFVLLPLVGLAVDGTVVRIVELKLQAAVDGAALGSGRLLGAVADPEAVALEFLKANFRTDGSQGTWGAYGLKADKGTDIVYTPGITKTIDVVARAMVPAIFARFGRVMGFTDLLVVARSRATRSDSRIVLIIDRSGSMSGTPMTTAVADAKTFIQNFIPGMDEVGVVVFSGSASVAYPVYAPGAWTYPDTIPLAGAGALTGPDKNFADGTAHDSLHQLDLATAGGYTNTSEALMLAYVELQKAHMRDLLAEGHDYRINAIVLLSDGVPTSGNLYPNNPASGGTDNIVRGTSSCNYQTISATWGGLNYNMKMFGWVGVLGGPVFATGSVSLRGLFQSESSDPTTGRGSTYWLTHPTADYTTDGGVSPAPHPGPPYTSSSPFYGCTSALAGNTSSFPNDITKIPALDRYGNAMDTLTHDYRTSHINGLSGTTSVWNGSDEVATGVNSDYNWGLAFWSAADQAAKNIRLDTNLVNRTGDTTGNMKINIYTIGFHTTGGYDDGLLKRIANDKNANGFVNGQTVGMYVQADDNAGLAVAFGKVATALLRLAQ